ncbi:Hypothetical protein Mbur_0643 [Methanococcoides burtonii DSM 6242]|uniref:Uncharacterized protein n=2 Tax=Methanococcoides burtonii TaxID=29291 RepID=Q12Y62_METBU|nr:Hypothetical protein Mbur_0643 [Methanococcoides burtonii DSM 6242]
MQLFLFHKANFHIMAYAGVQRDYQSVADALIREKFGDKADTAQVKFVLETGDVKELLKIAQAKLTDAKRLQVARLMFNLQQNRLALDHLNWRISILQLHLRMWEALSVQERKISNHLMKMVISWLMIY